MSYTKKRLIKSETVKCHYLGRSSFSRIEMHQPLIEILQIKLSQTFVMARAKMSCFFFQCDRSVKVLALFALSLFVILR